MSQNRTFDFGAFRNTSLLNRQQFKVAPAGIHQGYNVVINGAGTLGPAGGAIKIVNAPDLTSVAVSREGVRIEESGPDLIATLDVGVAVATNSRIDLVVLQHTFSISNNPATYAVIAGTPDLNPVPPAIPADAVVLAEVNIGPLPITTITNDQIVRRSKILADLNTAGDFRLDNVENATHIPVTTITALKAIPPEERADNQIILVRDFDGTGIAAFYRFDSSSAATADGSSIVTPDAFSLGTAGRWIITSSLGASTYECTVGTSGTFTDARDALLAAEASGAKSATIYIFEDSAISAGSTITVTIPIRFVGLDRNQTTRFPVMLDQLANLVFGTKSTGNQQAVVVEFDNIQFEKGGGQTVTLDNAGVSEPGRWFMRDCRLLDAEVGAALQWITLGNQASAKTVVELVRTEIVTNIANNMFKYDATGADLDFICRGCVMDRQDLDDLIFRNNASAGVINFHLYDHTFWRADGFAAPATLGGPINVILDGTSIFLGATEVPQNIDTVNGVSLYDKNFDNEHSPGWDSILKFVLGNELNIGEGTFVASGSGTVHTIARANYRVRGAGKEATILSHTMSSTPGDNGVEITGLRARFEDLQFFIDPTVGNTTGTAFKVTLGQGHFERIRWQANANPIAVAVDVITSNVYDCNINGNGSPDVPATGLIARGSHVKRTSVQSYSSIGIDLVGRAHGEELNVTPGLDDVASTGIKVQQSTLVDSTVRGENTTGTVGLPTGIEVIGDTGTDGIGSVVRGCRIDGFESGGSTIDITDAILLKEERSVIEGNIITNVGDAGIELDATAVHNTIIGNNFRDCTGRAARDIGTENNFVGNTAKNCGGGTGAIDITGSAGSAKTGNIEVA